MTRKKGDVDAKPRDNTGYLLREQRNKLERQAQEIKELRKDLEKLQAHPTQPQEEHDKLWIGIEKERDRIISEGWESLSDDEKIEKIRKAREGFK